MEGKEKIISDIIKTAEDKAAKIVENANLERESFIASLKADLENKRNKELKEARTEAASLKERRLSVAAIEKNKLILKEKQRLISSVYKEACQKILNMTDNIYRDFIASLLDRFAEKNDVVIIAKRDEKRITQDFINSYCEKKNTSLALSSDFHSSQGGIILVSKKYDKDLTLSAIVENLRSELDVKISKKLFKN